MVKSEKEAAAITLLGALVALYGLFAPSMQALGAGLLFTVLGVIAWVMKARERPRA